jgi:phytoene dehydrogenase-like protein
MSTGKPYDAIILGAGFSGLLAAALLAKRGRQVLVLEEEPTAGGLSYQEPREGFTHVQGPSLFLGFERDGLYDRLFMELGLSLSLLKKEGGFFQKSSPPFQVVLPHHRVNFYTEPGELLYELGREFRNETRAIRALINEIDRWDAILYPVFHLPPKHPPRDLGERLDRIYEGLKRWAALRGPRHQKAAAFLEPFGLGGEFHRGLEMLLVLFTGRTLTEATGLDLLLLLSLIRREVVAVRGGVSRLSELLIGVIEKYKGDVIFESPLEDLVVQQRRVTAIRAKERRFPVAGNVIVNLPVSRLPRPRKERLFLSFYFSINSGMLPPAMSEHLIMTRDLQQPPLGDNLLFLIVGDGPRAETAPGPSGDDRTVLRALVCFPESKGPSAEELKRLRDSIAVQLADLMPFSPPSLAFLGYDRSTAREERRLSAVDKPLLSRAKGRGRGGTAYYTFPVRNLFLLPDEGHHPAADARPARSALELVEALRPL